MNLDPHLPENRVIEAMRNKALVSAADELRKGLAWLGFFIGLGIFLAKWT